MHVMTRLILNFTFVITLLSMLTIGAGKLLGQFRESNRLLYILDADAVNDHRQIMALDADSRWRFRLAAAPARLHSIRWSPDGRFIAYFQDNTLYVMSEFGHDNHSVADDVRRCSDPACWSPDGTRLLLTLNRDDTTVIAIVNADDGESLVIPNLTHQDEPIFWSPDGSYLLVHYRTGDLRVIEAATGAVQLTIPGSVTSRSGQWSPDSRYVLYHRIHGATRAGFVGDSEIYVTDIVSGETLNISQNPDGNDSDAVWSPDGQRITYVSVRDDDPDLMVADVNGDHQRVVYDLPGGGADPYWHTESRLVFFSIAPTNQYQLRWLDVDTGEGALIAETINYVLPSTLSPDRRMIVFRPANNDLYVTTFRGETIITIDYTDTSVPGSWQWSPNSRYLAYAVFVGNQFLPHVLNIQTGVDYELPNTMLGIPQWQP